MSAIPAPATAERWLDTERPEAPPPIAELPRTRRRHRLSALVTTFNEAESLADCLRSLDFCDEIVVVDSHSSDDTVAIARSFDRVRVLERTYFGAASQKNWAIDRLRFDWVLILDADERVTPELRDEIEDVLSQPSPPTAFAIPRRTFAMGRRLRYSGWQNDRVVRLFRRDAARYPNRRVHADMVTLLPPTSLSGAIDHYMVEDLGEYIQRIQRYAWWGAAQLWRDGRRAGPWEIAVRPTWRFLRTYLVQLGVLEGTRGLVMCALQAYGTFLKYSMLWSWRAETARGSEPRLPAFDDNARTWAWPRPRSAGAPETVSRTTAEA